MCRGDLIVFWFYHTLKHDKVLPGCTYPAAYLIGLPHKTNKVYALVCAGVTLLSFDLPYASNTIRFCRLHLPGCKPYRFAGLAPCGNLHVILIAPLAALWRNKVSCTRFGMINAPNSGLKLQYSYQKPLSRTTD